MDVSDGQNKVQRCKEQYYIEPGMLEISELKWMGMDKFNSDDHYNYYCDKNPLEKME